jgi:hypothetical protein
MLSEAPANNLPGTREDLKGQTVPGRFATVVSDWWNWLAPNKTDAETDDFYLLVFTSFADKQKEKISKPVKLNTKTWNIEEEK